MRRKHFYDSLGYKEKISVILQILILWYAIENLSFLVFHFNFWDELDKKWRFYIFWYFELELHVFSDLLSQPR